MIIMYDENGKFYLDGKDKAILQKCVYENPYIPFNPFPKQAEMILAREKEVLIAGTIRGDFGNKEIVNQNVIHGSDSQENALIEIKRFFGLELTHGEDIEL